MRLNWKIILEKWYMILLILLALAVAIVVLGYFYLWPEEPFQIPWLTKVIKGKEITPPKATGNIDDTVSAIIKEISAEGENNKAIERDADFINSDSREISGFGQSYNENEF